MFSQPEPLKSGRGAAAGLDAPPLALSVRQPWAELILAGRKTIELRTWTTRYRGPLWLHSGVKKDSELEAEFALSDLFHGGFVGRVDLSSIVRLDHDRWERWRDRHLVTGAMPPQIYGWVLRNPVRLDRPLPAPGALGLFSPHPEVVSILCQAVLSRQGPAT